MQFERIIRKPGKPDTKKIFTYHREIAERLIAKGLGRIVTVKVEEVTITPETTGTRKESAETTGDEGKTQDPEGEVTGKKKGPGRPGKGSVL